MSACLLCELLAQGGPDGGWVAEYGEWVLMGHPLAVPGWVCVLSRRHVESIADASDREVAELGPALRWVATGLQAVTGSDRVYSYSMGHRVRHFHALMGVPGQAEDMQGGVLLTRIVDRDPSVVDDDRARTTLDALRGWAAAHPASV